MVWYFNRIDNFTFIFNINAVQIEVHNNEMANSDVFYVNLIVGLHKHKKPIISSLSSKVEVLSSHYKIGKKSSWDVESLLYR